ncbi:coth protein-domain-containing protein, partial [Cunninghamella echinulata]
KGVEISLAGRSSRWMDKLSYGLKIPKEQDLYGYRRLKLRAMRADPAYIREKLCYDMMKSVGLPVSGASYTRVIMNNQPIGLFLMIEGYKNPWYKNLFANGGKLDQGITYQGVGSVSDLSYFGDNVTKYDGPYKIEEDPDQGTPTFNRIMEFTKFLSEAPVGEGAESVWNQHIDMDSVIRSLAIEIAAGFSDGYIANANNFFLYDNLQDKRFTYLAADFDTTLGNTLVTLSKQLNGNYTDYPGFSLRPLTTKLIQVPAFKLQMETLLQQITKELVNPNVANKRIDELVAFLREDVEWDYRLPKAANVTWDGIKDQVPFTPDMIPPPLDWAAIEELMKRQPLTMEQAVYGPTGSNLYPNVIEWFTTLSNNMQQYFNQHPPSSN